jgi:WD40 repeat protein
MKSMRTAVRNFHFFEKGLVSSSPIHGARLIVFVDEIDIVQSLPFPTDELFAAIRELYNRRATEPQLANLNFCLLGVAAPSDLVSDPRITPFNIGVRIELDDFTEAEAAALGDGLGESGAREEHLRRVLHWTGGHPYLTQRLCQEVVAQRNGAGVDDICGEIFLSQRAREHENNLLFVRERILQSHADLAALLGLYSRVLRRRRVPADDNNPLVGELRLAGICRAESGALRVRNRVYRRVFDPAWIRDSMPGAERRRQRAAYLRGFALASGLAAVVLAVIGWLALTVVRQRDENRRQLYISDVRLAQQAWAQPDTHAALDFLVRHIPASGARDLRGFEWYNLWNLCHAVMPLANINVTTYIARPSPDGRRVYVGTTQKELEEYDAGTGRRVRTIARVKLPINQMDVAPDGQWLATADVEGNVKIWNLAAEPGVPPRSLPLSAGRQGNVGVSLQFSSDGRRLISAFNERVVIWKAPDWKVAAVHPAPGPDYLRFAIFSPDLRYVAFADRTTLEVWTADFSRKTASFPVNQPSRGAFCPDGTCLAVGDYAAIRIFDLLTGRETSLLGQRGFTRDIAISPDGKRLISSGADTTVRVWDIASGRQLLVFQPHPRGALLGLSRDWKLLVTFSEIGEGVSTWRFPEPPAPMAAADEVYALAFSPDSTRLATGGNAGNLLLWDAAARTRIALFHVGERIEHVEFIDADDILVNTLHRVAVWSVSSGREKEVLAASAGPLVSGLAPDGHTLAIADGAAGDVKMFDWPSRRAIAHYSLRAPPIVLGFSPDSRTLAVAGAGFVNVWSGGAAVVRLSEPGAIPTTVRDVAFSPRGDRLFAGTDSTNVYVWDWRSGRLESALSRQRGTVKTVKFSPDGSRLVTTSDDGTIELYNAATLQPIVTYEESDQSMEVAAFSPNGRYLAASGDDRIIRLYDGSRAP